MGLWDEQDYADQPALLNQKKRLESKILITSIAPAFVQKIENNVVQTNQEVKIKAMEAGQRLNHFVQRFQTSLKGEFGEKVQEEYLQKQNQLNKF